MTNDGSSLFTDVQPIHSYYNILNSRVTILRIVLLFYLAIDCSVFITADSNCKQIQLLQVRISE